MYHIGMQDRYKAVTGNALPVEVVATFEYRAGMHFETASAPITDRASTSHNCRQE
jgi:hypothetical protein